MIKVIKCERVDNPFYKALVENPCIRTEKEYIYSQKRSW